MGKHAMMFVYFAVLAALLAGSAYALLQLGASLLVALTGAVLITSLISSALAYLARVRQLTREGNVPPPFLQYL